MTSGLIYTFNMHSFITYSRFDLIDKDSYSLCQVLGHFGQGEAQVTLRYNPYLTKHYSSYVDLIF
jgi:hypothetical protein